MRKQKTSKAVSGSSRKSQAEPGESSVESLARTLWDGMYDRYHKVKDDMKAATDYIQAMFPGAENIRPYVKCSYFDYDGGRYFVRPEYSLDEKGKVQYAKITVHDCDCKLEPVTVDRDTRNVKGTLEKFFKKANPAGNSRKSSGKPRKPSVDSLARTLWDGMADSDGKVADDMDAAIAYLSAMFPKVNATVESPDSFYFDYDGVEYLVVLDYSRDENLLLHGGKLTVRDREGRMEPVFIDRKTADAKGTLEKFFKNAKLRTGNPEPSLMDRLARLNAAAKTINDEIGEIYRLIRETPRKP